MKIKVNGHIYDTNTSREIAGAACTRYKVYRTRTGRHFACNGRRIVIMPTSDAWEKIIGHPVVAPWDDSKLRR